MTCWSRPGPSRPRVRRRRRVRGHHGVGHDLVRRVFRQRRADERRAYASLRGVVDVRVRAALFFSLKEAVYKAVAGDAAAER